jgi:beta-ureidopropionase
MKAFTVACAQFAATPNDVTANLEKAAHWIERAAQENAAELVVLPETITTGFSPGMGAEELWDLVDTIPGRTTEPIARAARNLGVHVVLPTYEKGPKRGVVYNSAALINPQGEVVGVYRKTHLFPTERLSGGGWSTPGTEAPVFVTEVGTSGLIINAIGPDAKGYYYFGHSQIVSPIAQVLAQARGTEEIIAVELDPDPIKYVTYGAKSPMIFDHLQDRNLAAYESILQPARSRFEPAQRVGYLEE